MTKAKRRRLEQSQSKSMKKRKIHVASKPVTQKRHQSLPTSPETLNNKSRKSRKNIPFSASDRILLVGEGDFSFAASLVTHHGCNSVLATTLDSEEVLLAKHPQAAAHMTAVSSFDQKTDGETTILGSIGGPRVLCDVDATKLARTKVVRKVGETVGWDKIVFNFPHVGGKTKDVNRQVRYNQGKILLSLLVCSCCTNINSINVVRRIYMRSFLFNPRRRHFCKAKSS